MSRDPRFYRTPVIYGAGAFPRTGRRKRDELRGFCPLVHGDLADEDRGRARELARRFLEEERAQLGIPRRTNARLRSRDIATAAEALGLRPADLDEGLR